MKGSTGSRISLRGIAASSSVRGTACFNGQSRGDRRRRDWARAIAVECPDLLAVGGLALAGVAVVLVPTLAPLRPVVGLAFLLVAPGYATTVPLFPVPSARATDRATPTRLERAALTVAGGAVLAGTFAIGATLAAFRLTPGRAVGALAV